MPAGIHVIVEDADNHNSGITIMHWFGAIVENVRGSAFARGST